MSKSLKLYGVVAAGIGLMLVGAYNFADRSIADFPRNPPMLGELPAPIPEPEAPVVAAALPDGGVVAAAYADAEGKGQRFGLGRAALPEEVAAWNLDVSPDGTGLPVGSGNALVGEPIFEENCAACHGSFAEGVDNWPKLAGGDGTLADENPLKTVGSYWPHVSTVFDYVHRSMPFGNAQSLSPDEVYAITAYILYSNDLIEDDFEVSNESLPQIVLPNADGFIVDDRPETEYALWSDEPCMANCKDSVEITMRATVLDVTPEEESAAPVATDPAPDAVAVADPVAEPADAADVVADPAAETVAEPAAEPAVADAGAALDPALVAAGEKVFGKCKACHQVGEGAKNRTGPELNNIVGRPVGGMDGFKYSNTMASMGGVWDAELLAAFLVDPRGVVKGTRMAFAGLKSDADVEAIIAFLQSHSQ
jgi:cytochrome c